MKPAKGLLSCWTDGEKVDEDIKKKIYLKIFYSLMDWEWFHDSNTLSTFIHLLLLANRKPNRYRSTIIQRGEVLASLDFLSKDTGLSTQEVRTSLDKMIATGTLTKRKCGKNVVYTIVSYEKWQGGNINSNNESTTLQQRSNNVSTTPIDCKNEEIVRVREGKTPHGTFLNVFLTDGEMEKLLTAYPKETVDEYIDRVSMFIESSGKEYKSHYAVLLSWMRRDGVRTNKEAERKVLT